MMLPMRRGRRSIQFRKSRAKKKRILGVERVSERGAGVADGFDDDDEGADDDFDSDSNLDTDTGEDDEDGDEREREVVEAESGRAGAGRSDGAGRPDGFFLDFSVLYRVELMAGHSRRGANLASGFVL